MPSISLNEFRKAAQASQASASAGTGLVNEGRQLNNEETRLNIEAKKKAAQEGVDPVGGSLYNDIQSAAGSGKYTASGETGKQTRESLISALATKYMGKLDPSQVAAGVYGNFRGEKEGGFNILEYLNGTAGSTKPATAEQNKDAGFASRVTNASGTLDSLGNPGSAASYFLQQHLPNPLKSSSQQQREQAQRDLVNAVLRRESGAAISPAEFDNAGKQYFAQPGDSPQVLEQKKKNVQTVLQNLIQSSGSAFKKPAAGSAKGAVSDPLGIR